jgi:glycosyltransferase involved in cell wall biosynthesis
MNTQNESVCHVVNSVGKTSVPADIAVAQARYTDLDVAILAWFKKNNFEGSDAVDVHCLNAPQGILGLNVSTVADARQILCRYDIIQCHHPHSSAFGKVLSGPTDSIVISTEQNNHMGFSIKGLVANGVTNIIADAVTCVSQSVRESLTWWEELVIDEQQIHIIHNGVNLKRLNRAIDGSWRIDEHVDVDESTRLVGHAAMFSNQKGQDVLIRGIAEARRQGHDVELAIAGDGSLRDKLESIAAEEGIENKVHFLGLINRTDVYQLMDAVDVYAMPSRWEGFSAAAVEALATETACLFSKIDEFLKPFANVAAFHEVDDVDALAARLGELLEDDDWRLKLAKTGRKAAEEYSLSTIANRYLDLYESLA